MAADPLTNTRSDEGLLHTVGVFADPEWARRGIDALLADRFAPDSISVIAVRSPAADALFPEAPPPTTTELEGLGQVCGYGPLVDLLAGGGLLAKSGLAVALRRAGFQAHDGRIFQALLARGGVLVSVTSSRRAADALARLHAFGAGNAAIGAWLGRV